MNSVTIDDLLQYAYKETHVQRTLAIKAAIENNKRVHKDYTAIKAAKSSLNKVPLISPRKEAIDKVLNHAKSTFSK
ncbi:MAG TPA: hypothetical protein VK718_07000 [Ferruginibacter sp.]|jgi:hypothetical protein|nr:hypothetical protein [Ferruginibacter sp.]